MDTKHKERLTTAEISYLWGLYLTETMSVCVYKYFLKNVDDSDIQTLLEHALDLAQQHVEMVEGIFKEEGIQVPVALTEADVKLGAPRLFSDIFYLYYVKLMVGLGLATTAQALPFVCRQDILAFNTKNLQSTNELNNESTKMLLEKGQIIRAPYIPYPEDIEFVHKQSFIVEMFDKRPLIGPEVLSLFTNTITNNIGALVCMAFGQVTDDKELKGFFLRGKEIAIKHVRVMQDYLEQESLPTNLPLAINQDVTTSTESPFSDKLMMIHYVLMIRSGISNYGLALASSMRSDLLADFSRLNIEAMKLAEDAINIMIDNSWLERPPLSNYRAKG